MPETKRRITLDCKVDSYRSGWAIVEFLSHRFRYHSSERWTERIRQGRVRINGTRVLPTDPVAEHDVISYTIFHTEPEVDRSYDVIFEDDHMLAVSKSGNIPVHAGGVYIRNTLIAVLKNCFGDRVNLVHRLDRETSGLVLLSKDPAAARALGNQFSDGTVAKSYVAVVHGRVNETGFTIDAPIGKTRDIVDLDARRSAARRSVAEALDSDLVGNMPNFMPKRQVDFDGGKSAVTRFKVEARGEGFTVLEAVPHSGRTHQIRVHLQYAGYPIVGDKVYGDAALDGEFTASPGDDSAAPSDGQPGATPSREFAATSGARPAAGPSRGPWDRAPKIDRQALHCRSMTFEHPLTGERMVLCAGLPADLRPFVAKCR